MTAARYAEIALPIPLARPLTYAIKTELAHHVRLGARVVVPFRGGREVGVCVGLSLGAEPGRTYKTIADVPDELPALPPPLLAAVVWLARYYAAPLGIALRATLPALLTSVDATQPAPRERRVLVAADAPPSLLERDRVFGRAKRQRALFELLESLGGRAPVQHLVEQLGASPSVVEGLVARGLARVERETTARTPYGARGIRATPLPEPTSAQVAAIRSVLAGDPGSVFLLHGVTGSGKTLVYLEVLRDVLARGKTGIVLVPEIALTPQTVDRFRGVFGDLVAVLHSALSDGERLDEWRALRSGAKRIAIGARSAVFAPLEHVGAIIVDEEHEASYKQGEAPRYHAREVAIVRAKHEGAVVVLGTATPSLESWVNATSKRYTLLSLPERVGGGRLPRVEVVDLRRRERDGGIVGATASLGAGARGGIEPASGEIRNNRARGAPPENQNTPQSPEPNNQSTATGTIPTRLSPPTSFASGSRDPFRRVVSEPLETALRDRLTRNEQTLLLLNRRGYSAFVQCAACGEVAACPNCSISLTYHRTPERLICHYCAHAEAPRIACGRCGQRTVRERGLGTQQVERLLGERFPTVRIARMDVDTTSGKWAHATILDRVARGEVDILLGTQMIAKGLDFPNVTLVGVVDADVGINLPDFRASERCFQLLAQVAGRAGRGPKGGEVFIQTRLPDHYAVRSAVTHDYHAFVAEELRARVRPPYPPTLRLTNVVVSGTREEPTSEGAQDCADWVRRLISAKAHTGVDVLGPAPCAIDRIKSRWRWHFLIKARDARTLTSVGRYLAERYKPPRTAGLRVAIDRDPVTVL